MKINRGYDGNGKVTVNPKIVATIPGYDDQFLSDAGDNEVSIENSVAFRNGVVYFANSAGLVQGWDISDLLDGGHKYHRVFRFWTGDDTDASVVIDDEGFLYVASEYQRFNERSQRLGQLMKLDPSKPDNPIVWSIPASEIGFEGAGGSWSTPALYGDYVYFTTAAGRVLEVDRKSGKIVWELAIGSPAIASPVVVDGVLIQGDCTGALYAWDVSSPRKKPKQLWKMQFGGCVESTPAVWHGWLYVGTRLGQIYGIADPPKNVGQNGPNCERRSAVRHATSAIAPTSNPRKPTIRMACLFARVPTPSAANPANSPAMKPPTWARQSIPGMEKARTMLITMIMTALRSRAAAIARCRRR